MVEEDPSEVDVIVAGGPVTGGGGGTQRTQGVAVDLVVGLAPAGEGHTEDLEIIVIQSYIISGLFSQPTKC